MTDNRLVNEFDLYGALLAHGNRVDIEDGDEWASWHAEESDVELDAGYGPMETHIVVVYDDDGNRRSFVVAWQEISE